jgi:hypothetical protein
MVGEMATRVRTRIEADNPVAAPATDSGAATVDGTPPVAAPVTTSPAAAPARPEEDNAIKASSIVWSVLAGVFRRLFARLRGRGAQERS